MNEMDKLRKTHKLAIIDGVRAILTLLNVMTTNRLQYELAVDLIRFLNDSAQADLRSEKV